MANYTKRLNVVSSSGPPPTFEISDGELSRLEEVYGCTLSRDARDGLLFLSESFLRWRKAELRSESYADLRKQFEIVRKAVEAFQSFAYGALTPITDSGGVLSGKIGANLPKYPISIQSGQLLVENSSSPEWDRVEDSRGLAVMMDATFLMSVGFALDRVIGAVEKEISQEEASPIQTGFTPGTAFRDFMYQMRGWAKRHKLKRGAHDSTQAPSRFSHFLYELNRLFPAQLQEPVNSAGGVAERLRDVVRNSNATK